ncbi:hypothetical protein [uncultured phage MedDCM-OCT-S05-C113]|nr:hypothetical protein [uncultured phage MedDCM-OCT-S05-C113]
MSKEKNIYIYSSKDMDEVIQHGVNEWWGIKQKPLNHKKYLAKKTKRKNPLSVRELRGSKGTELKLYREEQLTNTKCINALQEEN